MMVTLDELSLEDRVAMSNGDQRRIFDNVKAHLLLTSSVMKLMNAHADLPTKFLKILGMGNEIR